jgi:putative FmdB family regulatory protein
MPTYGYRCSACGHEFEIVQRITDKPLTSCPKCGGKLSKMLYPVGISFKGSGFYTTDYKSGANLDKGSSNGVAAGKETGSTEGGKESKPEGKPEAKSSEGKSQSKADSKPEKAS